MARVPKPWYHKDRKCWFVTISGERHNLGPEKEAAFRLLHELMAAEPKQRQAVTQPTTEKTVAEILDLFLDWCQTHRAERTYDWYHERCQWFVKSEHAVLPI